jgi:ribosome-binding protein aMBF1 (putative translation factor)
MTRSYRIRDIVCDMARERRSVFPGFDALADERRDVLSKLVSERQRRRMSQTEVAALMRTSQSAVARLESGEADVRLSTLQRYAAAVGCDLQLRLGRSQRP